CLTWQSFSLDYRHDCRRRSPFEKNAQNCRGRGAGRASGLIAKRAARWLGRPRAGPGHPGWREVTACQPQEDLPAADADRVNTRFRASFDADLSAISQPRLLQRIKKAIELVESARG